MPGQLFIGREEEQRQFRSLLSEIRTGSKRDTQLPTVILLYGQGGIGKTTLAERFRRIVAEEFKGHFQTFFLDWGEELKRDSRLQVERGKIEAEAVFDAMHKAMVREQPAWSKRFKAYNAVIERQSQVQDVITTTVRKDEKLGNLSSIGADVLAKLLVVPIPQPFSSPVEKASSVILDHTIQIGAEQLARLRQKLRDHFDEKQYELLLRPQEQIARALGQDLAQLAQKNPLILFLDTYEIVDSVDFWMRDLIRAAGPRLVWTVSGRHDLWKSGRRGTERDFKGYDEVAGIDFHVIHYDMQKLATDDTKRYFATAVPERSLTQEQLETVQNATLGIPLAVKTAADIWKQTGDLESIVSEAGRSSPHEDIVQAMIDRYLLHFVDRRDEEALYALALADGDITLLQAMLESIDSLDFETDEYLNQLHRKYSSVYRGKLKLHDEPAAFLRNHLRLQREEKRVQRLIKRAIGALQVDLEKLERLGLVSLEARCNDEDWVRIALRLLDYFFWVDEEHGWRWLIPRFIESLVYNHNLRSGLLQVTDDWQPSLSSVGRKRLEFMRSTPRLSFPLLSHHSSREQDEEELLSNLEPLVEELDWLGGDEETERKAIWHVLRGEMAFREDVYQMDLSDRPGERFTQALLALPKYGQKLRERLAQDFTVLGDYELVPAKAVPIYEKAIQCNPEYVPALIGLGLQYSFSGHSNKAIEAYQRAIDLLAEAEIRPENVSARHNLATALSNLAEEHYFSAQYEEAFTLLDRARDLDPDNSTVHAQIGDTCANLGDIEGAIAAHKRAIELDPGHVRCYAVLAVMYRQLGLELQYAEQLELARQAATPDWLSNEWDPFNRACFAAVVDDNLDKALELLEQSFALYPGLRARIRHEPAFHFIRHDPRFMELASGR
jgi:tetratricopeptide (TPR) repeat protein